MSVYKKPGVYITHTDETYIRTPKNYLRKRKIRKLLELPHKNEYISPGVYITEFD